MRRNRWVIVAALAAALSAVAAGCGGGGSSESSATTAAASTGAAETGAAADTGAATGAAAGGTPASCTASIGIIGPFTGDAAVIGQEQLHWAQFAVERFNAENGTDFKLVQGDAQLDPAQGSTVAPQFVSNSDILAVVGPAGSQVVEAVGDIFKRAGMPFISGSATAIDLTSGKFPTFFRVVPTDAQQAPTDADYMVKPIGAKKVYIIDDQTSYSRPLADGAEKALKAAGVATQRDSVSQKQTDFSALVSKISDDTDVVFLPWQIAANAQLFGQQMQEQGKKAIIFGSDGLFSPSEFKIDGSYVSTFAPDITGIPADKDLVDAYKSEFGDFGTFGPPTYAATNVVMNAIKTVCDAGETPSRENVLAAMKETDLQQSILGQPIKFTAKGDLQNAKFFIFNIVNGKYKLVP